MIRLHPLPYLTHQEVCPALSLALTLIPLNREVWEDPEAFRPERWLRKPKNKTRESTPAGKETEQTPETEGGGGDVSGGCPMSEVFRITSISTVP